MAKGRRYLPALIVALLIVTAYALRFPLHGGLWQLRVPLRSAIYGGIYTLWGVSVSQRIIHPQQRRQFVAVAVLMVFWVAVRTAKIFTAPDGVGRYCWYLYYIPMLFIPLLTTLIAAQLGRPEDYRLPRWTRWLFVVAAGLALLVLTNDVHRLVFAFPGGKPLSDADYTYGPAYLLAGVWCIGGLLATLTLTTLRSRLPGRGKRLLAPIVPAVLLIGYHALYLLGHQGDLLRAVLGDMTAVYCLLVICILESCLRVGLIPSNTRYAELFSSADLQARIVDEDYTVQYASLGAAPLSEAVMRRTEAGPVMLQGGVQLQGMAVPGGHVLWTSDLSELLRLQQELEDIKDELTERNEALRHRYEEEQKHRRVLEQNRLYDALQNQTQSQINEIYALVRTYRGTSDADTRQRLLARVILLGSYVKRRKDFILSASITPLLPGSKLKNALAESYRALALMGVTGTFAVDVGPEPVKGETLTAAYDLFEQFAEAALSGLHSVNVTVGAVNGTLRERIFAHCDGDFSALEERWPGLVLERDDDGVTAVLELEGGGAR